MEIVEKQAGEGWTVLAVIGHIDAQTAPQLEAACRSRAQAGVAQLAIDLTGVSYMSSAGLRALLIAVKLISKMALVGPQGIVSEVLEVAGFLKLFQVVPDVSQLA